MRLVTTAIASEQGLSLGAQFLLLFVGFVVNAPGEEEVVPVDVGLDGADVIVNLHVWLKCSSSPVEPVSTVPLS